MKIFKESIKDCLYFHLFLILCLVLAHWFISALRDKSFKKRRKEIPFDAVIVREFPTSIARPNIIYKARVFWAKHLYDSGYTRNIIFSGSAVYTPYIESRTMKPMLLLLAFPKKHLFTERSRTQPENVYYSWKLARKTWF